jgi:phosphoenolpyruvate carboxylase
MPLIPKCMSTQHPDNATAPSFAVDGVIRGDGEIVEAFEVFSMGCDEQMWDSEGKDADSQVVKKLLSTYPDFFREQRKLGTDCAITLRVPNPAIELAMRKSMVEALQSIPTAHDVATGFYGEGADSPIQEVILPFTTSGEQVRLIAEYYERFIVGQQDAQMEKGVRVKDWVGEFNPKRIRVIPLIEDLDQMVTADDIVRECLRDREAPYQRVFLARSDPALNYGLIGADLMLRIALQRVDALSSEMSTPMYPIIGAGSVPFRGHLTPTNLSRAFREYPSVHTYTLQSAFKYDYEPDQVRAAIQTILAHDASTPVPINELRARAIIDKVAAEYQECVRKLAPVISKASGSVPRRRDRKLHVGLFGYGRTLAGSSDVTLPRAIAFTASLYSIGVPPEILGMAALNNDDLSYVREVYPSLDDDLAVALTYANETRVRTLLGDRYADVMVRYGRSIDRVHEGLTSAIWAGLQLEAHSQVPHYVEEAARLRKFLG